MKKIYIDVRYFFLDLGRRIKNLWRWLPIVWNDRDWDDGFIFEVLKFKLKNTADYTEQREWFVGYEHEVSRMRLCVKLIERVQEEWYGMEYFDYHTSTFEFIPIHYNKDSYEMYSEIIEDNLDGYFKKYPLVYKRVVAKLGSDSNRILIAIHMGHKNHERAKRLLFNTLNKHIENWWN